MARTPVEARAHLFALALAHPPSPDAVFSCRICGRALRGRTVTLDDQARATCGDCTGREPDPDIPLDTANIPL